MSITVSNIRTNADGEGMYIGRVNRTFGMPDSIFHNPFPLVHERDRGKVWFEFLVWWYAPAQRWLRAEAVKQMDENEVLICWCHPKPCHGHIIAGYVNAKRKGLFDE